MSIGEMAFLALCILGSGTLLVSALYVSWWSDPRRKSGPTSK